MLLYYFVTGNQFVIDFTVHVFKLFLVLLTQLGIITKFGRNLFCIDLVTIEITFLVSDNLRCLLLQNFHSDG